jgi:hypothetical protein
MINLTTTQKVNITVTPLDALGKIVPNSDINGAPLWNSSDVNIASLVIAQDGFSAYVFGTGAGTATISVIANTGTVANPLQISGSLPISVAQAPAVSLQLSASTVISQ